MDIAYAIFVYTFIFSGSNPTGFERATGIVTTLLSGMH
jgi:hypothetical protein